MSNIKCSSCEFGLSEFNPDFAPCLDCRAEEEAGELYSTMEESELHALIVDVCETCPSYGRYSVCADCTTH